MTASYVDVLHSHVQILGKTQSVPLVTVDGDDGLLAIHVETIFGLSQFEIRESIKRNRLDPIRLLGKTLDLLKYEGVVKARATQALFVPRDQLRLLIEEKGDIDKLVIYRSIWEHLKPVRSRATPKQSFRAGMLRNMRRLQEKIRNLEAVVETLQELIEDLLRADTQRMTPASHAHPAVDQSPTPVPTVARGSNQ